MSKSKILVITRNELLYLGLEACKLSTYERKYSAELKMNFQCPFAILLLIIGHVLASIANLHVNADSFSLAERKLLKIIRHEEQFFLQNQNFINDPKELSRKAQDLVSLYESYLAENPNDTNALILFGKFLNKVGQKSIAIDFFLKADTLNPKLAVVKQQIGNFLVENEKPLEALPFFISAIQIDPLVPDYHFHLGNFLHIYKEKISMSQILGQKSVEQFSHECFAKAAEKRPISFEYRLRFAQSFFDYPECNRNKAIAVWDKIMSDFNSSLKKSEIDYINLCKARIMLELNQNEQAGLLVQEVSTKALVKSKKELLENINKKPKNPNSNKEIKGDKTGNIGISNYDPHIARLKLITEKLIEEKLIKQLHSDRIRANQETNGEIRFSVNSDLETSD